jgi:hypothetical protein
MRRLPSIDRAKPPEPGCEFHFRNTCRLPRPATDDEALVRTLGPVAVVPLGVPGWGADHDAQVLDLRVA